MYTVHGLPQGQSHSSSQLRYNVSFLSALGLVMAGCCSAYITTPFVPSSVVFEGGWLGHQESWAVSSRVHDLCQFR